MKRTTLYLAIGTLTIAMVARIFTETKPAKAETSTSIRYSAEYKASIEEKVFGVDTHQTRPDISGLECMQGSKYVIEVSDEDIQLMARVVMSEGSILSIEGKQAIAETIINRVLSDKFPNSVNEVVYMPDAFSTKNNGEPTIECLDAVLTALEFHAFPESMLYFRANRYHEFAYPYMQIGNTYFSTTEDLRTLD